VNLAQLTLNLAKLMAQDLAALDQLAVMAFSRVETLLERPHLRFESLDQRCLFIGRAVINAL
jgi:hypothetical protein